MGYEPKDKNIVLPQDRGLDFKFIILTFIMFGSMPGLRHENIFPMLKLQKEKQKRSFWHLVQIFFNRGKMEDNWSGVVSLITNPMRS